MSDRPYGVCARHIKKGRDGEYHGHCGTYLSRLARDLLLVQRVDPHLVGVAGLAKEAQPALLAQHRTNPRLARSRRNTHETTPTFTNDSAPVRQLDNISPYVLKRATGQHATEGNERNAARVEEGLALPCENAVKGYLQLRLK